MMEQIRYEGWRKGIAEIMKEHNAIILAHNYQRLEVQNIADYVGDSLELAQLAAKTEADTIVLCGVYFMAETAKILNPDKKVLIPVKDAGCPMADMVTAGSLRETKKRYPDAAVVTYINSSAEVKAESDICCTSSNAMDIVRSLSNEEIIFVPDRNLGAYVQSQVPEKRLILWDGFCPTHNRVSVDEVLRWKKLRPNAEFLAHPECAPEVLELADHICSTSGMLRYAKRFGKREFIIGTEIGLVERLEKENQAKIFYHASANMVCPSMKETLISSVARSLDFSEYEVEVPEEIAAKARSSLEHMLKV